MGKANEPQRTSIAAFRHQHKEFFCGWGAGMIETVILFPASKLVFRQQLYGLMIKEAVSQLKREGFGLLYRGLLPPLIMRTTTRSIMFGTFDKYKKLLNITERPTTIPMRLRFSLAAFLAGATEATLCPLERVQVLLQTRTYHKEFRNTREAFAVVGRHGLPELYRGVSMIVIRNGTSNILFFSLREPLREIIFNTGQKAGGLSSESKLLSFAANFTSGAILGASISTLFFPINVVKHRMQSTLGTPFQSPLAVFRIVWEERHRSVKELFRGVQLNFTRSLIAWGITNSAYEILVKLF